MQIAWPHGRDGGSDTKDLYVKKVVVIEEEDEGRENISTSTKFAASQGMPLQSIPRSLLLYRICLNSHLLHRIPHPHLLWLRISTQVRLLASLPLTRRIGMRNHRSLVLLPP